MLYLYGALLFFKNFLDYEKLGVRMQILKRHKLTPPPPPPLPSQNVAVTFSVPKSIYDFFFGFIIKFIIYLC